MLRKARASLERWRPSRGGYAVLAASMLAIVSAPAPARAGLFDFLFNPKAPVWNPFAPTPEAQPAPQRAAPVQKNKPRQAAAHRLRHVEKVRLSNLPLASRDFMDDSSLRDGDAVMTPNGIKIFTGPRGARHSPQSFASLGEIKGLGKRERSALAALDARTARATRAEAKPSLASGRSAAEHIAAGAVITDPKGRTIRYVGP
jgi:hypothetical protein